MWHSMFAVQVPIAEKILRTVLVYATILILFRLTGKRDLATLNIFDFVVLFLLSNVVQNAIIGNDTSLLGGIIGAATLVAINAVLNRLLVVSNRAARVLEGKPTTIIEDGRFLPGPARRLGLRPADVDKTIRVQNGDDIKEVATGVMEPNGQLVLTLKEAEQSASKGDIAGLTAQLKAMQASLERLSAPGSAQPMKEFRPGNRRLPRRCLSALTGRPLRAAAQQQDQAPLGELLGVQTQPDAHRRQRKFHQHRQGDRLKTLARQRGHDIKPGVHDEQRRGRGRGRRQIPGPAQREVTRAGQGDQEHDVEARPCDVGIG